MNCKLRKVRVNAKKHPTLAFFIVCMKINDMMFDYIGIFGAERAMIGEACARERSSCVSSATSEKKSETLIDCAKSISVEC